MAGQDPVDTFTLETSPAVEYLQIFRRRKWLIITIAGLAIAIAIAAAFLLPSTYQSVATILIEEPGVSDDLTKAANGGFAEQRLQLIQQRVMTTAKLIGVIEKLDLYQEARLTVPLNVLAENMRSQISLRVVGAESIEAKADRSPKKTTAFTLGFTGRDPEVTQRITQELVDLYMAENERSQRDKALGAAGFLTAEAERMATRIRELEAELAAFKTKNAGTLPEEMAFNMQLLDRTQTQLLEVMRQAQSVRERQAFMQAQLLSLDPQAPINTNNPETLNPRARLRLLKSQYSTMSAKYGAQHPDVITLRRQIEALDGTVDGGQSGVDVMALKATLEAAQVKYGDSHPEIIRLKREIKTAEAMTTKSTAAAVEAPDNPIYIQTLAQLSALNAETAMGHAQVAALQDKLAEVEARIVRSPEVEREYLALKREYDTAIATYQEMEARESKADLAKNVETEQMGERLSLIEPPPLPIAPISPNRPAIVLLGIVLGLLLGFGAGVLVDSMDGHVYGHRRLASIIGAAPLVVMPRIVAARTGRSRFQKLAVATASFALVSGLLIAAGSLDGNALSHTWELIMTKIDVS